MNTSSQEMRIRKLVRWVGMRPYLRFGVADRLARWVHPPDSAAPELFSVNFYGLRYEGDFANFIDWSVYYFGAYSREELDLLKCFALVKPNSVMFDVGANTGHHALFASTCFRQVFAFEPYPPVVEVIRSRMRANGVRNLEVVPFGLGDKHETLPFHAPSGANRGTGSFIANGARKGDLMLRLEPGDDWVDAAGLDQIDFIKIDVEGFELRVIEGLRKSLERFRPAVLFEYSQNERGRRTTDERNLFPIGYSVLRFFPERVTWGVFRSRSACLVPVRGELADGSYLAVPEERVAAVIECYESGGRS